MTVFHKENLNINNISISLIKLIKKRYEDNTKLKLQKKTSKGQLKTKTGILSTAHSI